jgi:DnaJ like chaperone protein
MSWWLGAGMGFLRGGPVGALIGGAVQHWFTKKYLKNAPPGLPGVRDTGRYVTCLVAVLTHTAAAGGRLSPPQKEVIRRFLQRNFHFGGEELGFAAEVMAKTEKINPALAPLVAEYRKSCGGQYTLLLLALAYQMVLAEGGEAGPRTEESLRRLARLLDVSYEAHDGLRKKYGLPPLVTPFSVLGVPVSADNETIRRAYRQQAGQWHPDRVAHLGTDHAGEAHKRFLEIQAAYSELKEIRNL